jgi:uncharacterized protein (DUF1810 family)
MVRVYVKPEADPFNLARFVDAQARDYPTAIAELIAGRKRTHWIWYVLPQLRGLGVSRMSQEFGIASLAEAGAYLAHPILGPRLRECVAALNQHAGVPASAILGTVDAKKLQSCVTLFDKVEGAGSAFALALDTFFAGEPDAGTLELLARAESRA